MAPLYDKSLTFPAACSNKKLESRTKGTRRPSAWAPENEDVEDSDEPTRKQHWCPVTVASDDMELVPLPLKKVAMKAFLPANIYLTHFLCTACEREPADVR